MGGIIGTLTFDRDVRISRETVLRSSSTAIPPLNHWSTPCS